MTKFLFCFLFLCITNLYAQVGINTTSPNESSMLDVFSANKGLLLPRVPLVATTNFSPLLSHVAGMTIYNTATAGDVTPGSYYNNGTKWIRVGDASVKDNIYVNNGTLTGDRIVTQNTNRLYFQGPANGNEISFDLGASVNLKVGTLGTNTSSYLRVEAGTSNIDIFTFKGSYASLTCQGESLYIGTGTGTAKDVRLMTNGSTRLFVAPAGNIGIGNVNPKSILQVSGGDVNIDSIGSGIILKSPDSRCWRITVDNTGALVRTLITCP
ncbi:hypothetical protein [Flavobacterium sp.]|uniref:hypothetical protein n=1 Tax=Flavobacterium sp. TaxID=239 RepID=UPI003750C5DF